MNFLRDIWAFDQWLSQWVSIQVRTWSFLPYGILQLIALQQTRGTWRKFAALPAWPMVLILAVTMYGISQEANLAGILLTFIAPYAFLYMCIFSIVFGIYSVVKKNSNQTEL